MNEDTLAAHLPTYSVPPDGYQRAAIALHRFFEATWQEGGEARARIEAVLAGAHWTEDDTREYQAKFALSDAEVSTGRSQQEKSQ